MEENIENFKTHARIVKCISCFSQNDVSGICSSDSSFHLEENTELINIACVRDHTCSMYVELFSPIVGFEIIDQNLYKEAMLNILINENKKLIASREIEKFFDRGSLASTHFDSSLNTEDVKRELLAFFEKNQVICTTPDSLCECYLLEDFDVMGFKVTLFNSGNNLVIEFKKLQGNNMLFLEVFNGFRKLLNQNDLFVITPIPWFFNEYSKDSYASEDDKKAAMDSLIKWLRRSPEDAIKTVVQTAMVEYKETQIMLLKEVGFVLEGNVQRLFIQTLGFIDKLLEETCLMDEESKTTIIVKLKEEIEQSLYLINIPNCVKSRAEHLLAKLTSKQDSKMSSVDV